MINPYSLRNMRAEVPNLTSLYSNLNQQPTNSPLREPLLTHGAISGPVSLPLGGPSVGAAPVTSTGGVAESPWAPRWLDFGLQMEGAGGFQVPTFNVRDIAWQEATPVQYTGDNIDYSRPSMPAGVRWTDNANRDLYSWWAKADPLSNSVQIISDPNNPNGFSLQVKTADKQGTRIPYVLQGEEWVPQQQGIQQVGWDTNTGFSDILPALAVMAPAIAGIAFPGLFGGATGGAAATGDFFGGLSAEAAGAFGTGAGSVADLFGTGALGSAAAGLPAELGGVGGVVSGSTAAPSLMEGLGTGFAGTGAMTGTLPSIVPEVAAGGLGLSGLFQGVGGAVDTISDIADVVGGVNRILNPNQGGTNIGRRATGLPGLLSGLYGNYANRQLAGALRDIAGNMQQVADPYLQKLRESYENPNAYLNSPEMQAVLGLEANKLAGIDAAQGRLSNDINRTALLQKLAQSRLGDYRSGLQQAVRSVYKPEAFVPMLQKAAEEDAARYADLVGWVGSGGNVGDVWNDIKDVIDAGSDIWDVISGWWD